MNINIDTLAAHIESLKAEWTALHNSGIDRRTRAYKQERNRISNASYALTQRYALATGMRDADVVRKFGLGA